MNRKQFTFFGSFRDALIRIKNKKDRCDAYDAIIAYALDGTEPDLDTLSDAAAMALILIRPTLDSSRKKAENSSKPKPRSKQTESEPKSNEYQNDIKPETKPQGERERERGGDRVRDRDRERMLRESQEREKAEAFDRFWSAYPKKVGKGEALKAFEKVMTRKGGTGTSSASPSPTVEDLLAALERQKRSDQWTRDGGRYIPNPSTWLNQGRWEDELRSGGDPQVQHHGAEMSPAMRAAVDRMMEGEDDGPA
jgi:hypothetical protein